jgi:YidC/Oxa1 family membrane protein insertase
MERGGLARFLLFGVALLALLFFMPRACEGGDSARQPLDFEREKTPQPRAPEKLCSLWADTFHAQLSTRGASLKHFWLTSAKYKRNGQPIDLSTTPDKEFRRQLRFHWRNEAAFPPEPKPNEPQWQLDYDSVDWVLERADGRSCVFTYEDDRVALEQTIRVTGQPYELEAIGRIENRSAERRNHALTVHTVAWRRSSEVTGQMFTVSPYITHVECVSKDGKTTRLRPEDFESDEFNEPGFAKNRLNLGDWHQAPGNPDVAAVSNAYFTHAVVPNGSAKQPVCQTQIELIPGKSGDPRAGAMYRARLAYPPLELAPKQRAEYRVLTYVGPKERDVLAAAGGGKHQLSELIDLGFFSAIAKILVAFLLAVYGLIPNWGVAIIILTITARTLLFPLAIPSIKSMMKMRELKPELDALNVKYKDDAQAKGLAQMELWRKHNVNPLKGCLPQLASMPVWFALYTTLQTAVELYNIPFLWFPDLSLPDPYYVLPFVIGGTSFLQQKLMPMQGDPTQQKMMLYMMPAMFTVFMLFLPSGLGVYMFTNGVLGIIQQQTVEWHVRRTTKADAGKATDIQVKVKEESASAPAGKGKRKGKGGKDQNVKLSEGRALLDKGKA